MAAQQANKPFVCYITEHLIKKVTQNENLKNVTSLVIPYTKDKNEKIRFLENLHSLVSLQELIFSNHLISKIENLDKLVNLRELNLADNRITKLENLDKLVNLEELNLSGNRIDKIPKNIAKNGNLKVLRLERNNISAIGDIAHLQPIVGLTNLSLHPNPVTELPHYQDYSIFTLRTLHVLDGDSVSLDDRRKSIERFSRDSEEKLKRDLTQLEGDHKVVRQQLDETTESLRASREKNQVLETEVRKLREQNRQLSEENEIRVAMLEKKSAELTKAVAQYYELQKEYSFYKLDNPTKSFSAPNGRNSKGSSSSLLPKMNTNDVMGSNTNNNAETLESLSKALIALKVKFNQPTVPLSSKSPPAYSQPTPLSSQPSLPSSSSSRPPPPSHFSPTQDSSPSPPLPSSSHPTNGYFLAHIPRPNQEITPPQKGSDKNGARRSSNRSPELLEKENSKLREQCDSLTQKLYKSQKLFIQKLTELQGDREDLKTRLERLENTSPSSSPSHSSPTYPANYPPPSSFPPPSSSSSSHPRHTPPGYHPQTTSPPLPSHFRPSPPPQKYAEYVTPEDWIFTRPSHHP